MAVAQWQEVRRLGEDAEVRRVAQEDKVRALTRRLVGVASHQMLEQEGLADRLAEIIARQVDLETRQAAVTALAERAGAALPGGPASLPTPTDPPSRRGAAVPGGLLPADGADGPPKPRTELARRRITEAEKLPVRQQFDRLEDALTRLDGGQIRTLAQLSAMFAKTTETIRGVLADLKLNVAPLPSKPRPLPLRPDAFTSQIARTETAFEEVGRWGVVAEAVPLRSPIEGAIPTSNFGSRKDPFTASPRMHAGMDFRSPVGSPVHTTGNGKVVTAGQSGGYGNLVEVDHGNGLVTRYAHLSSINVAVDQAVAAGSVVGLVGSTGRSTGPHLHYETRLANAPLDPAGFIAAGQRLYGRAPATSPMEEPHTDVVDD